MKLSNEDIERLKEIKDNNTENRTGNTLPDPEPETMWNALDKGYVLRASHKTTKHIMHLPESREETICRMELDDNKQWYRMGQLEAKRSKYNWCKYCADRVQRDE